MNKRVRTDIPWIRDRCIYVWRSFWLPLVLAIRWFDRLFDKIDRIAARGLYNLN